MEERAIAKEIAGLKACIKVSGYDERDWCNAIFDGISRGRYDYTDCAEQLKAFSLESFVAVLTDVYA